MEPVAVLSVEPGVVLLVKSVSSAKLVSVLRLSKSEMHFILLIENFHSAQTTFAEIITKPGSFEHLKQPETKTKSSNNNMIEKPRKQIIAIAIVNLK